MSIVPHFHSKEVHCPYGTIPALLVAAARQVLIAGAAVAGVMAISGCSHPAPSPQAMPALGASVPQYADHAPSIGSIASTAAAPQGDGYGHGTMASPINRVPDVTLVPPRLSPPTAPPASGRGDGGAVTPAEERQSRSDAIADLINRALTPGPVPLLRQGNALTAAERAVAPLAETVDGIDAGLRAIVENLRNADTAGYKASRTAVGDGRDATMQIDVSQGELVPTEWSLDVAIDGNGFLPVRTYPKEQPDGAVAYTRNGKLFMNGAGDIVAGGLAGYLLVPQIKFPVGVTQVTISPDGDVRVSVDRQPETISVGQISLAVFADPSALRPLGGGLYGETEASGRAVPVPAGAGSGGRILQGHFEASNLDLARERMRLKFLQNWRANIISMMEDTVGAAR